jgi:molybdopterin synthase catalytic subunit
VTRANRVSLVEVAIDPSALVAQVVRPEAGAIDLFLGIVRDHAPDETGVVRPVTLLEYEAYRPMALAEMGRIVAELEARIGGVELAVIHRVGALRVGEIAVACVASAPHRGEAFEACRALIDEIKARVPIWKREHGPDGAYWVGWHDARCGHAPARAGGG